MQLIFSLILRNSIVFSHSRMRKVCDSFREKGYDINTVWIGYVPFVFVNNATWANQALTGFKSKFGHREKRTNHNIQNVFGVSLYYDQTEARARAYGMVVQALR